MNFPITSARLRAGACGPALGAGLARSVGVAPVGFECPGAAAVLGCSESLQAELPEMGFQIYAERNI